MKKQDTRGELYKLSEKLASEELRTNAKRYPKPPIGKDGNLIAEKNLVRPIAGYESKRPLRDIQQLVYDKEGKQRANPERLMKIVGPNREIRGGHKLQGSGYTDGKNTFMEKNRREQQGKEKKTASTEVKCYKNDTHGRSQEKRTSPASDTRKEIKNNSSFEKKRIDSVSYQDKKNW